MGVLGLTDVSIQGQTSCLYPLSSLGKNIQKDKSISIHARCIHIRIIYTNTSYSPCGSTYICTIVNPASARVLP